MNSDRSTFVKQYSMVGQKFERKRIDGKPLATRTGVVTAERNLAFDLSFAGSSAIFVRHFRIYASSFSLYPRVFAAVNSLCEFHKPTGSSFP